MMSYETYYNILDKDKNILHKKGPMPCFSGLLGPDGKEYFKGAQYLEYDFFNYDIKLSKEDMYKYFLFLKKIPEFTDLMPYDVYKMAEEKKICIDITKHNGIKVFSLLTVIRAVREDRAIVQEILKFDPEKEYSWTKLGILKACGSVNYSNNGHWLTNKISIENVNYSPKEIELWKSIRPTKTTGLIYGIHDTWMTEGDGYTCSTPVTKNDLIRVCKESNVVQKKPRVPKVKADNNLILDF